MKSKSDKKAVLGIVSNASEAEHAVDGLNRAGFVDEEISASFPDKAGTRDFAHAQHTKAPESVVAGASVGGVIGATLGLLAGLGTFAIPGVGPVSAAGTILAGLGAAVAGAAAGALTGGLIGFGVPEVDANRYEGKIKGGNISIAVHVDDAERRAKARDVLEAAGAADVVVVAETSVPEGAQPVASAR